MMELCCHRKITIPFKPFEIPFSDQVQNINYKSVETKTFLISIFFYVVVLYFSLSVSFGILYSEQFFKTYLVLITKKGRKLSKTTYKHVEVNAVPSPHVVEIPPGNSVIFLAFTDQCLYIISQLIQHYSTYSPNWISNDKS